ncbi:MAG: hypothetical protein HOK72_13620, partial [Flavobacteriales bacterium]|nr:hypothetical protein [Flavobacteriales bacterium]
MKKVLLICPFLIFISLFSNAQIDYQVQIDDLYSAADASDGSGNEDPTWKVELTDNGGGAPIVTGCLNATIATGTWWSASGGVFPINYTSVLNSPATSFATTMECWEEDGHWLTGCDDDPCIYTSCGGFNSDDGHAPAGLGNGSTGNTGNINFINDAPCTWNQYELDISGDNVNGSPANYKARISVYWEPNGGTDAGSINGGQTVCSGDNPTLLGSVAGGTPSIYPLWYTYQWQEDVGCTGTFTDIPSATSATYDPPIGISQTTCFQREVRSANCVDMISNSVTVTVNSASTDPSSLTGTPLILCGAGTVDLTINGGTLGTGATWEWYDGDPNGAGIFIFSTGTTSSITGQAITASTNYFVRAEGACGNSNTVNVNVVVNTPNLDPTSVTSSSLSTCAGTAIDLTVNGGGLGSSALWTWYDTDPSIGTPTPIYADPIPIYNVTPTVSTTYYVRAEGCDTSLVVSVAISVDLLSTDPTGVNAVAPLICNGGNTDLTVQGGSLGTGATWQWYEVGCGSGTAINNGPTINVAPIITTTYYVRAEGTCGSSNCSSITVTVSQASTVDPTNVTTPSLVVCVGAPIDLTVIAAGTLGSGAV